MDNKESWRSHRTFFQQKLPAIFAPLTDAITDGIALLMSRRVVSRDCNKSLLLSRFYRIRIFVMHIFFLLVLYRRGFFSLSYRIIGARSTFGIYAGRRLYGGQALHLRSALSRSGISRPSFYRERSSRQHCSAFRNNSIISFSQYRPIPRRYRRN